MTYAGHRNRGEGSKNEMALSDSEVLRMVTIERLAAQAWPATTRLRTHGWLLRHTPTVGRRRSNSALPLDRPQLDGVLAEIESFYASRNRPSLVQISPAEVHPELDNLLAERGYESHTPSLVLTAGVGGVSGETPATTTIHSRPSAEWLALFHRGGYDKAADSILPRVAAPVGFAVARQGDSLAGIGMFAVADGWAGVFCMATESAARRRGIATGVLRTGARWAAAQGARNLYLQVEKENGAARALYTSLGFEVSHSYHFRQRG
jgi:ribosomal protein S18 acetylase RimI-like enzyme